MSVQLESARSEWEQGYRRFEEAARAKADAERLLPQLEAVTAELRRRVGSTFTLGELADAYDGAESWVLPVLEDRASAPGWARTAAMVAEAAFHLYARGASDYAP